jgi:hypothetical protein
MSDPTSVTLPPGVAISPGRETTQIGANNQNVQGLVFTLTLPNTTQTSVFVPYAVMAYPDQVAQMFADRVAQIQAISALGTQ